MQEHPVPEVDDGDILVKTVAVAQNPTDWKCASCSSLVNRLFLLRHSVCSSSTVADSGRANIGSVSGCDWSGYVVKTGKNVTSPRVGQHVAGFVMGSTFADSGAYAEYVRTPAELSWVVPDGTLSHEEAATMGCACVFHPVHTCIRPTELAVDGRG